MEGLIPLVYKKIKRSSVRRQYRDLSSHSTMPVFHVDEEPQSPLNRAAFWTPQPEKCSKFFEEERDVHYHQRRMSLDGFAHEQMRGKPRLSKEIVGFRSHRNSMFRCITGA